MTQQPDFDVAICGYGPTGMVAASLLAQRGHRVWVCERWPTLYGQPRMATIDGGTARIVQNAADAEQAFRNSVPRPRYIQANEAGQILIDHDWDRQHICGFPYRISLHQPDIEDALDARVRAGGAVVDQSWEMLRVEQDEDEDVVRVAVRHRERNGETSGPDRVVTAKYLIGADGARSTVRKMLGIEQEGWPFRDAWLCIDAVRKRDLPDLFGLSPDGRVAVIFCVPEGRSHSVIPLGTNHLRFNFRIDPDTPHDGTLHRADAYHRIGSIYGLNEDDIDVYREALYPFEGKLAKTWRVGRIFLAGDAAHVMTPFYGQGGCSGLRDAINIAWKLDLVLSGNASDRLLDTYEAERIPNVRVHIDNSDQLGATIFMRDPEAAEQRDRLYRAGAGPKPQAEPIPRSAAIDSGAAAIPPAGTIGPQGVVRFRGRQDRLDDIAGWGFQLIAKDSSTLEFLTAADRIFLERIHTRIAVLDGGSSPNSFDDVDGVYGNFFSGHGISFALVRPDFIVFGAGRSAADLPSLVGRLRSSLH